MSRKVGRPPLAIPTIDWKTYIPLPIAAKVDLLLLDPVTGRTRYGARSALVNQLLLQWLNERGMKMEPALASLNEPTHNEHPSSEPTQ